jgi:hypothetical protein
MAIVAEGEIPRAMLEIGFIVLHPPNKIMFLQYYILYLAKLQ